MTDKLESEVFYTAQEVASLLKIRKTTVYEWIKKNRLPATRVGKQFRIAKTDLDAYLRAEEKPGEEPASPEPVALTDVADRFVRSREYLRYNNGLILSGQEDLLALFGAYFQLEQNSVPVIQHSLNYYDSLYSLYFEKVHGAFVPLFKSKKKHPLAYLVPGVSLVAVHVATISYGIYTRPDCPCPVNSISDLLQSNLLFMQGEKGSFGRIVLDEARKQAGLEDRVLNLCDRESISSMAAAAAVESGQADAAIGCSTSRGTFGQLAYHSWEKADLKLVFRKEMEEYPAFQAMIRVLQSDFFRRRLHQMPGYETSGTGWTEYL